MDVSENFLYFIWQFRLFNTRDLFCTNGEKIEILKPGNLNRHSGPDFNQAKLLLDHTIWVGNIEIHLKSSDWMLHGHQNNKVYDSVILHVVYVHDRPVLRTNGTEIPVLVLKGLFDGRLLDSYTSMISSLNKFPCEKQIGKVDGIIISSVLSRVLIERMEQKSAEVLNVLGELKGNWDETFYRFLARNFGFKVNAVPFELLAASLPSQILAKHRDNALQIDALIFGQAGFLQEDFDEEYPKFLKNEYNFLAQKYKLIKIEVSLWKFLRMRPQSFPTIRLAQFSGLFTKSNHFFSKILELDNLQDLYALFREIPVNGYWFNHYHFNNSADHVHVQPGMLSVQNIIINTVCLFLFTYGKYTDQYVFADLAFSLLESMPAEKNAIISQYSNAGLHPCNAFQSQALLQLNKCYCSEKKCLNCGIGIKILNK